MKIKLELSHRDRKTLKGFPVRISVSHQGKRAYKVIFHSEKKDFDQENQMVLKSHPDYNQLVPEILNLKARFWELEKLKSIDEAMDQLFEKKHHLNNVYEFAEEWIHSMNSVGRTGNAKIYQSIVNAFKKRYDKLYFNELDYRLLSDYKRMMQMEGYKKNTIHLHLRTLRAIYNEAVRHGIVQKSDIFQGLFKDITENKTRTINRFIAPEIMKKLRDNDFSEKQDEARDIFLLSFYLGGLNLVDIYHLEKSQIRNGRIYLSRHKTGGYVFDLKIFPETAAILKNFENPSSFLLPFKSQLSYDEFRNMVYKRLIRIQKQIEEFPEGMNLSMNASRHTFSTLGVVNNVNREIKALLMGHELNDVQAIYELYSPEQRDAEHEKIIQF